jgi:hypothetical protein
MIIKKWNGNAWVAESPKVNYTDIVADVTAGSPVSIFSSGKLKEDYLPISVFGGMKFVGTITATGSPTPGSLAMFVAGSTTSGSGGNEITVSGGNIDFLSNVNYGVTYANITQDIGLRFIGHYWVVTNSLSLMDGTSSSIPEADWGEAVFDDGVVPTSAGGQYANNIGLEAGDWLIITGYAHATGTFKFSVINNTYSVASYNQFGVVKIGYTTNNKNYAIASTNDGLYVNVPWVDTTYNAGNGISLSGTTFNVTAGVGLVQTSSGLRMEKPIEIGTTAPASTYQIQDGALWFDLN